MIDEQWRTTLVREIRRKLIHLTGLSVPAGIVLLGKAATASLIALALAAALLLEAGRLKGLVRLPEVREFEQGRVAGYIYYILGALLTVAVFRPMIALTAMLMLSLGDAVSGIVGSVLQDSDVRGARSRRTKPFPIVMSMFLACILIGYASSPLTQLPFAVYLAGALGATIADCVPLFLRDRGLDDNLTIPLFSGGMMSLAVVAEKVF